MSDYDALGEPKKRFDNFVLGFLLSVLLPIITLTVFLLFKGSSLSLVEQIKAIFADMYFIRYVTLALIPNLVLFFFFYKTERWKSCYGLAVATLLYLIVSVFQLA